MTVLGFLVVFDFSSTSKRDLCFSLSFNFCTKIRHNATALFARSRSEKYANRLEMLAKDSSAFVERLTDFFTSGSSDDNCRVSWTPNSWDVGH